MPEENNPKVIPVIKEYVSVVREVVETGHLNIKKTVDIETVSLDTPVRNEGYEVTRHPMGPELYDSPPPPIRTVGNRTIISVIREVAVLVKKYQVIEEIHLDQTLTITPVVQEIDLRKENVTVTRG